MFVGLLFFFFPHVHADYDSAHRAATSEEKTGCPGIIPQYTLCSYWLHSCFSHSSPPRAMRKTYRQEKNHCKSNKIWLASLLPVNACEERRGCGESNRDYYLWVNTNFMPGWPSPACYRFFFILSFEAGSSWAAHVEPVPAKRQLARISAGASLGSHPQESAMQVLTNPGRLLWQGCTVPLGTSAHHNWDLQKARFLSGHWFI